jgi:hypothetical protein
MLFGQKPRLTAQKENVGKGVGFTVDASRLLGVV